VPALSALARRLPALFASLAILAALWLGVSARFIGLEALQLAVDEYYFVRGVQLILEHGLPHFPTGGYYVHGLLAQYVTAAFTVLFGENGFGYRLPAVLFNLASVVLLYLYSKKFLDRVSAGLVCAMLLISAWHIEFARFIRMYSLLQFLTIFFFLAMDKAFVDGRRHWRYVPHLVAVLGILTHAQALILIPLLFAPLLVTEIRKRLLAHSALWRFGLLTTATALICVMFFKLGLRRLGISDPLPDGYVFPLTQSGDFKASVFACWSISNDPVMNLTFFLAVCALVTGALLAWRHFDNRVRPSDIVLALLLVTAVFHMFMVWFGLVALLVFRYDFHRLSALPRRAYVLFLASLCIGAIWMVYALFSIGWRDLAGERADLKTLFYMFFGWPGLYSHVFAPWFKELPFVGLIAFLALAYQIASRSKDSPALLLRNPAFIGFYVALCVAGFHWLSSATRYFFVVYPFMLLTIVLSVIDALERLSRALPHYEKSFVRSMAALACVGVFICTEDFQAAQLVNASSEQVRFRLGKYERYAPTWYMRADYESPARFAAQFSAQNSATTTIVSGLPPVSYYLGGAHAVYYHRNDNRFYNVSRVGGTVDLWSNQRLLSTEEEVRAYTRCSKRVLFIRKRIEEESALDVGSVWNGRMISADQAYKSLDGRIEVIVVTLKDTATDVCQARQSQSPASLVSLKPF
jgi:hypothetical protein